MPIVFIHGVNTRPGPDFQSNSRQRETFFRETVARTILNNPNTTILQPMWGDLVPTLPSPNPVVPPTDPKGVEAFGAEPTLQPASSRLPALVVADEKPPTNQRLLTIAKRSFSESIDVLWQETLLSAAVRGDTSKEQQCVAYGMVASAYAAENPQPEWVQAASDDSEYLKKLAEALEKWRQATAPAPGVAVQAFGVADSVLGWLTGAVQTVEQKAIDIPTNALLRAIRPGLTEAMLHFFGDVFYYQTARGTDKEPGDIVRVVLEALREARKEADKTNEKLVVVGHSMGGNILYDIFTYYAPDLAVDFLVTVGCQAAVFKQLALFNNQANDAFRAGTKAPKPDKVGHWLNVFDPQDVLSFAFEPEFNGVTDFFFESPGGVIGAHGAYFERIRFYERMVARLTT